MSEKRGLCLFLAGAFLIAWIVATDADENIRKTDQALVAINETVIAEAGNTVSIPISISTNKPLSGIQLSLKFDANVMTPGAPVTTPRTAGMSVSHSVADDRIIILIYDVTGAAVQAGDGPVLTLPFSISKDANGLTELRFQNVILADEEAKAVPVEAKSISVMIGQGPPASYDLLQNFPNPFNPETRIHYQLPRPEFVTLTVYNVLGEHIRTLVMERKESGYHDVVWDGRNDSGENAASGIYFYHLKAGTFTRSQRMLLLK